MPLFPLNSGGGGGGVTSVAISAPSSILTVSGSPIISSGTLALTLANQSANLVWAGPTTGAAAAPTFRSLIAADMTMASGKLLGRSTAGSGAVEEITVGSGLTLSGGSLSASGGGTGDVVGPSSAIDNRIAVFSGTTGKIIQDSSSITAASGVLTGLGPITIASSSNNNIALNPNGTGTVKITIATNVAQVMQATSASGYCSFRCYNDQNSGVRALEQGYTGSSYTGPALTNGLTGEVGYLTTTGNYALQLGANNTLIVTLSPGGNNMLLNSNTDNSNGRLQFKSGTTQTEGIAFGNDSPSTNLYRHSASELKTDGSFTAVLEVDTPKIGSLAVNGDIAISPDGTGALVLGNTKPVIKFATGANNSNTLTFVTSTANTPTQLNITPSGSETDCAIWLYGSSNPDTSGQNVFAFGGGFGGAVAGSWNFGSVNVASPTSTPRPISFVLQNSGGRFELLRMRSEGWLQLFNSSAPGSNPSSSGYIYTESGALKYRGSSGTVTTLGAA